MATAVSTEAAVSAARGSRAKEVMPAILTVDGGIFPIQPLTRQHLTGYGFVPGSAGIAACLVSSLCLAQWSCCPPHSPPIQAHSRPPGRWGQAVGSAGSAVGSKT